jgi:hypothetical protein
VSITDGVLEFEGSEQFVASLVDKFTSVIQTALAGEPDANETGGGTNSDRDAPPPASIEPPPPEATFEDIFAATETGVQILKPLPASTKAQRTVNLAKLYLYGLQMLQQRDTARFAEIGRACKRMAASTRTTWRLT